MSYWPGSYKSLHPPTYKFDGHTVYHVDAKDEPDLWMNFKEDTPKWQLDAYYDWEQPGRKNVLRSFNKYVFEAYEYEDYSG